VVATKGSKGGLRTYLQTPAWSFVTAGVDPLPYVTRYNPQALALGDLNRDGLTDVAIADENNGLVLLYRKTNCHEHLLDGSFEAGIPNPYWLEASTNFGTPLCTVARCGSGGGTAGPRSGAIWAWFGGFFGGVEVGTLDQDVVLPPGVATLRFYLWNGVASGNHTDDFRAFVDGVRVFATFENNPAYVYGYAPVSVDLSGFADGGVHRLHFDSLTTGPGISNFSLDDVSLEVCQPAKLLSMSAASVPEGDSGTTNITFTVSLSSPSSQNVSVSWATADGTAHAETDYIPASGSLVFPPGATTATIAVPVLGDRIYEGNEWLFVNLIDPVGAVVTQGQGIGVILDDDPAGLSIDDVIVTAPATNDASAAFTVTLAPPNPSGTVTVDYATADGTAIAGIDYETAAGTLTFPPGTVTQSVPVAVLANPQFEGARTFSVTLSGASGAPIAHAVATGTIMAPGFHTLTPCRLLDTRNPLDGPSLAAQTSRSVQVAGRCGIPATARAVSLNVAVTQATAPGHLRLYRAGSNVPLVSTINYAAGQTRSNNTIVPLSVMGQLAVSNGQVSGTAHAIFDVNGYFTSE